LGEARGGRRSTKKMTEAEGKEGERGRNHTNFENM
jgi:hypothetical protein